MPTTSYRRIFRLLHQIIPCLLLLLLLLHHTAESLIMSMTTFACLVGMPHPFSPRQLDLDQVEEAWGEALH